MRKVLTALALTTFAGAVFAQQALKPEEMIKYRKAGYSFMSWNMGKIKANLEGTYNKEQVAAAANLIAATANSGMGALFGAGTDKEVGGKVRFRPADSMNEHDRDFHGRYCTIPERRWPRFNKSVMVFTG
jgi:hypothetical protein